MPKFPKGNKHSPYDKVSNWYTNLVGCKGHYYHREVIVPETIRLLKIQRKDPKSILDLGCGVGVLASHIPETFSYVGIDFSAPLIEEAKKIHQKKQNCTFITHDVTTSLPIEKKDFAIATLILCLQDIEQGDKAIKRASEHLKIGGKLLIVMNHPCFRIPKNSSWEIDEENQIQYRRVDRYMSALRLPILTNPGKAHEEEKNVFSYHDPLSTYSQWLSNAGFSINLLQEWTSNKISTGRNARRENIARREFPLFLAILAEKR